MGVLSEIISEIQKLENERDKAEFRYIETYNKSTEIKHLARRMQTRLRILEEQTEKARQGPIRGGFWLAIDEVLSLNKEITELLMEDPPPVKEE